MVVRRRIIRLCIPGHATISLLVDDEQVRIVDTQGTERPRHGTYVHHDGGIIVAFSPTSTDDRPLSVYRFEAYPMVIGVYRSHNFRGILLDPDTINIASESLLKTFCDQMQYRVVQKQWKRPADCVKKMLFWFHPGHQSVEVVYLWHSKVVGWTTVLQGSLEKCCFPNGEWSEFQQDGRKQISIKFNSQALGGESDKKLKLYEYKFVEEQLPVQEGQNWSLYACNGGTDLGISWEGLDQTQQLGAITQWHVFAIVVSLHTSDGDADMRA